MHIYTISLAHIYHDNQHFYPVTIICDNYVYSEQMKSCQKMENVAFRITCFLLSNISTPHTHIYIYREKIYNKLTSNK